MKSFFQFKQFSVDQTGCAMKINTDGVLLGALADADNPKTILDIGTGTGVIALMLAQRFSTAVIDGVEVDATAAQATKTNFANSPFADRLTVYPQSFEDFFTVYPEKKYDLIIINPPFYINSLKSPEVGKQLAKHTDENFFKDLMARLMSHLTEDGAAWLILPVKTAELVKKIASDNGLFLQDVLEIKSYPEDHHHREILTFGLKEVTLWGSEFVIYDEPKQYSKQYELALKFFFTIF
jgi:tRNA1Val (adenine37-N6)-methyltransferase